jgi:hypothetical protein
MRCLAICFVVESIFNVSLPDREVGIQQENGFSAHNAFVVSCQVCEIASLGFSPLGTLRRHLS